MNKIAIIGGGIGGLTAAISLKSMGFKCDVYERSPEFKEVGAAISVWPNALRVFQHLNILNRVLEKCGELKEAYIKTSSGKVLARTRPVYDLPAVCTHRADLLNTLLQQLSPENLHPGHELQSFYPDQNNTVTIKFTNSQEINCNLLIGADGINSVVRKQIMNDGQPVFRGHNVWRGIAELPLKQGYGSETWGRGSRVGIVPIRDGLFGWWATANEPFGQNDEPEGTRDKLKRIFRNWHDPIPQLFDNSPHIIKTSMVDRTPVRGWSKSNAVSIGDAAHPTTPNLGQGACMAIEGAYLLARCLQKYGISEKALQTYEKLHYPRTKEINQRSLLLGQIGQWQNPIGTSCRDLIFSLQPEKLSSRLLDKYFNYDVTHVPV